MSYFGTTDWLQRVAAGQVPSMRSVNKFGKATVGSTIEPVCSSGFYRTPSAGVALEVLSDDSEDGVGGLGARSVTIQGLDENFLLAEHTVNLNGTTPVPLPANMTRVFRWFVLESGSYGSTSVGSHVGELTIREVATGDVWSTILNSGITAGQSLIGCYSYAANEIGYAFALDMGVDATKEVDLLIFLREQADVASAPFGARRLIFYQEGIDAQLNISFRIPIGPMPGPADLLVMARVDSGTAEVSMVTEHLIHTP